MSKELHITARVKRSCRQWRPLTPIKASTKTPRMTNAIRIKANGGPEVMRFEPVAEPAPGPGQVVVSHRAIGVNFIDVYHRTGLYPLPLPTGLGMEAAGVVSAVGPDVDGFEIGDRVAYFGAPPDGYSEARAIAADRVLRLPSAITFSEAAAMLLKGMTVEMLIRRVFAVQPGQTVLLHAAAGGVGLIACQWSEPPRGHRDRHRGQRRKGRTGPGPRLSPSGRVHSRVVQGPGSGDH